MDIDYLIALGPVEYHVTDDIATYVNTDVPYLWMGEVLQHSADQ